MIENTKILIADDHDLVRDAIAMALNQEETLSVDVACTFNEAEEYLTKNPNVDIVMLDVVMPGMDGFESIKRIIELAGNGAVVLFSGNVGPDLLQRAIKIGCYGLIPKTLPLKSLTSAINLIASGQAFVPVTFSDEMEQKPAEAESELPDRDLHILRQVAQGKTNKEIAWDLNVSEVTIKARMRAICAKLAASNRASAVINAKELGMI